MMYFQGLRWSSGATVETHCYRSDCETEVLIRVITRLLIQTWITSVFVRSQLVISVNILLVDSSYLPAIVHSRAGKQFRHQFLPAINLPCYPVTPIVSGGCSVSLAIVSMRQPKRTSARQFSARTIGFPEMTSPLPHNRIVVFQREFLRSMFPDSIKTSVKAGDRIT